MLQVQTTDKLIENGLHTRVRKVSHIEEPSDFPGCYEIVCHDEFNGIFVPKERTDIVQSIKPGDYMLSVFENHKHKMSYGPVDPNKVLFYIEEYLRK